MQHKNEDYLKNEDDLKSENNLKCEDDLKKGGDLKNEGNRIMKTTFKMINNSKDNTYMKGDMHIARIHNTQGAVIFALLYLRAKSLSSRKP